MRPEIELLFRHRDYYGSYHHHKEQMGYAGATLYLAAATAVAFEGRGVHGTALSEPLFALMLSLGAVVGFVFVSWQLRHRTFAARVVAACTNLITNAHEDPDRQHDFRATPYNQILFPQFLVDELRRLEGTEVSPGSPQVAAWLTYIVMGAWTVFAACAVCKT